MARDVYSLRIFCAQVTAAAGKVGPVVPANFIYVVRDIDINTVTGGATDVISVLNPVNGNLYVVRTTGGGGTNAQWRGRQVYSPGEQVAVESFAGTWDVMISGYQLTLP